MKIGIIGAMDIEVRALKNMMDNAAADRPCSVIERNQGTVV